MFFREQQVLNEKYINDTLFITNLPQIIESSKVLTIGSIIRNYRIIECYHQISIVLLGVWGIRIWF